VGFFVLSVLLVELLKLVGVTLVPGFLLELSVLVEVF
jgi:hypothetical protein